jgi:hypothetical protein
MGFDDKQKHLSKLCSFFHNLSAHQSRFRVGGSGILLPHKIQEAVTQQQVTIAIQYQVIHCLISCISVCACVRACVCVCVRMCVFVSE